MKIITYISTIFVAAIMCTSCDFLDVSDSLSGELSKEEVFNNPSMTRRFHRYIYSGIPDMSYMCVKTGGAALTGLDNPWPSVSDETKSAQNNIKNLAALGYHAGNAVLTRWQLYKQIRQANLFLEEAHAIPKTGEIDYVSEEEFQSLRAEARFLRAYYHFLLFELYGPVPIELKPEDDSSTDLDFYRASVDEIVEFLDKEFLEVAMELKEEEPMERKAVPTRGVAMALRAKTWIYAACPLLNGGYAEALNLKDNTGKQLFPVKDDTKWSKALESIQAFIDYAEGRYSLYKYYATAGDESTFSADRSLYNLFQGYTDEIIWASTRDSWGTVGSGDGTERRGTPRTEATGFACLGLTQELVDAFFMSDGLSIDESPLYNEEGFTTVTVARGNNQYNDKIFNMYLNREPRFYQAVTYQGKRWHVSNNQVFFHKGSGNDVSSSNNPYTGYLMYKRMNQTIYGTGSSPRSFFRPTILYRLAEFYLLYAEVLNEVTPNDPRIIQYVDKIRARAGIPLLSDIKPEIIGNQELQRKAIRAEMKVELCIEGQRYFDVRRWMIADKPEGRQGGPFHGMDMNSTEPEFHQRTVFENRIFTRPMYLYPIPLNEIQKSTKLVQNPGW